jgi:CRP-like cAMP-binding protein/predicted Ser/Thr protein kinase
MIDWANIARLCREALARPPKDRSAFLDEACAGEVELRRLLRSLLEPAADSDPFDWFMSGLGQLLEDLKSDDDVQSDGSTRERSASEHSRREAPLRASPFSVLKADTLADLLSAMQYHECGPGDCLIRQGDPAEFLLLILSGHACASVRDTPSDRPPVGEFGAGDIVGEMSLLTNEPRTADVVAQTAMRFLKLSASDFHFLAGRHPDLPLVLTEVVTERLGHGRYDGLGGKDVHGYQIVQCVGRGGMGVVYEARHVASNRKVALKMMNHRLIYQLSALRRFQREAAILETLDHPSIARLYECFPAYRTEFLAMEFCEGKTLSQLIALRGPLKEDLVRRMLGQLAGALGYVHGRGIVHRDLKPSNIVLTGQGTIKLLDFGIVTVEADSDLWRAWKTSSRPVGMIGTPRYMAPEQFSHKVADRRADFYGLACVAFEALSGRSVVEATDVYEIMREHARFVLPPREAIGTGVSEDLYAILVAGLEHDPDKRLLDLDRLAAWAAPLDLDK